MTAHAIEMSLPLKVRGELVRMYDQNGTNAAKAMRIYHRNHLRRRDPCTPQGLCDLIKKFEDTGSTCNKPRSGRLIVSENVIKEVHHTLTSGHMQTTRGTHYYVSTLQMNF